MASRTAEPRDPEDRPHDRGRRTLSPAGGQGPSPATRKGTTGRVVVLIGGGGIVFTTGAFPPVDGSMAEAFLR